jgi:hypothetical protein
MWTLYGIGTSKLMAVLLPDWRSPEERFGLYVIREDGLQLLATCGSPEAIGIAITVLASEGEFEDVGGFGVLDSHGTPDSPGEWLVNPFNQRKVTI